MPKSNWNRVTKNHPCPICGKHDWCLVSKDGKACICPRTESARQIGESGFLHMLDGTQPNHPGAFSRTRETRLVPDLSKDAERFRKAIKDESLKFLARILGLPAASVAEYGVGWSSKHMAWSLPMTSLLIMCCTAIQMRKPDGRKWVLAGGKAAVFMPRSQYDGGSLVMCEGVSDAMAAHSIGYYAAGRFNCNSGIPHLVALARAKKPERIIVFGDSNKDGKIGAMKLADALDYHNDHVKICYPPDGFKDLREWVKSGATHSDLEDLPDARTGR